ncbi:hypothetical protein RSJ3_3020 [Clostridium botulinum]|nr:hypothetical protein RSJ3_3020 [Clostridium botulinum]
MKKWYDEEYEFEIEVTGFLRSDHTERYCRNGEEVGDMHLWLSNKFGWTGYLFQGHDDYVSNHGVG